MKLILIISACICTILFFIGVYINYKSNLVRVISISNPITNENKKIPLMKCPFCGADKADLLVDEIDENGKIVPIYAMYCSDKLGGCGSSTAFYDEPINAILAWNKRTND